MRYLIVLCIWFSFTLASNLYNPFDPTGPWFYVVNSSWSMMIFLSIIILYQAKIHYKPLKSWLLYSLLGLESATVLLNFVTVNGGLTPKNSFYWLYYDHTLLYITIAEAMLLLIGAPWSGVYNNIKSLCSPFAARLALSYNSNRCYPPDKVGLQKTC